MGWRSHLFQLVRMGFRNGPSTVCGCLADFMQIFWHRKISSGKCLLCKVTMFFFLVGKLTVAMAVFKFANCYIVSHNQVGYPRISKDQDFMWPPRYNPPGSLIRSSSCPHIFQLSSAVQAFRISLRCHQTWRAGTWTIESSMIFLWTFSFVGDFLHGLPEGNS